MIDDHTTTTLTRSELEERFLALVRDAELPQPLTNARRHGYEIDFLWPAYRLAVEVDGFTFHGGRAAFERDRRRDADLQAAGLAVTRVTHRQLTGGPVAVAVRIAQMIAAAGHGDAEPE